MLSINVEVVRQHSRRRRATTYQILHRFCALNQAPLIGIPAVYLEALPITFHLQQSPRLATPELDTAQHVVKHALIADAKQILRIRQIQCIQEYSSDHHNSLYDKVSSLNLNISTCLAKIQRRQLAPSSLKYAPFTFQAFRTNLYK